MLFNLNRALARCQVVTHERCAKPAGSPKYPDRQGRHQESSVSHPGQGPSRGLPEHHRRLQHVCGSAPGIQGDPHEPIRRNASPAQAGDLAEEIFRAAGDDEAEPGCRLGPHRDEFSLFHRKAGAGEQRAGTHGLQLPHHRFQ
ncbi:hypothetical protein DESC_260101 [Desulfosarcina cetonica]|nr:hypothetical protein DESC_260101 [Desulfosarcina cetonica]